MDIWSSKGRMAGAIFKGYWPQAGESLVFDGGRSLVVVDALRGVTYTTGDGTTFKEWPPADSKKLGRAVELVRPHSEINRRPGTG